MINSQTNRSLLPATTRKPIFSQELAAMEELVLLLRPLEKMTRHFSGANYVTLSWVFPMVQNCLLELADIKPHTKVAKDALAILKAALADRYLNMIGEAAKMSMMLDPRFKSLSFPGIDDAEVYWNRLHELYKQEKEKDSGPAAAPAASNSNGFFHRSLMPNVQPLRDEFVCYRGEKEIPVFIPHPTKEGVDIPNDPLAWWEKKKDDYPIMAKLARRYLAIPATSVPSESVFSTAGRIAHERRSHLHDGALNACLIINRNWQFVMSVDPEEYQPPAQPVVDCEYYEILVHVSWQAADKLIDVFEFESEVHPNMFDVLRNHFVCRSSRATTKLVLTQIWSLRFKATVLGLFNINRRPSLLNCMCILCDLVLLFSLSLSRSIGDLRSMATFTWLRS